MSKSEIFLILIFGGVLAAGFLTPHQLFAVSEDDVKVFYYSDEESHLVFSAINPTCCHSMKSLSSFWCGDSKQSALPGTDYVSNNHKYKKYQLFWDPKPQIINLAIGQSLELKAYLAYCLPKGGYCGAQPFPWHCDPPRGCMFANWSTDDSSVAELDYPDQEEGMKYQPVVTGKRVGSALVRVSYPVPAFTYRTAVFVNVVDPSSPHTLVISPATQGLSINETKQLQAIYDPDGPSGSEAERNIDFLALWSSDNPAVAAVDGFGKITAAGAGATTIRAKYAGLEAVASITVRQTLSPESATIAVGGSQDFQFFLSGSPETSCDASWSVNDTSIATVEVVQTEHQSCTDAEWGCTTYYTCDSAKVTGKKAGTTTISVSYQGFSATAPIEVKNPNPTLRIDPTSADVEINGSRNFIAYYDPDGKESWAPKPESQVTDCSISWSSSDTSIATVTVNQTSHQSCTGAEWAQTCTTYYTCDSASVTGAKAGSTTISVTYMGITAESTIVVRNSFPPTLRINDPISAPYTNVFLVNYDYPYGNRNFYAYYDPDGVDSRPEEVLGKCDTLSWSSADATIATVEVNKTSHQSCTGAEWAQTCTTYYVCDSAKVTAKGVGATKIRVTYQGMTAEETITVRNPNPPVFRINPASFNLLTEGRVTTELIAYFDQDGTDPSPEQVVTNCSISWSSADTNIATVEVNKTSHQSCTGAEWAQTCTTYYTCDSATASGKNFGATKIRATYQEKTAEAPVAVRECCEAAPQCNTCDLEWASFTADDINWNQNTMISFIVDGYIIYLGEDPQLKTDSRVQTVRPGQEKFYAGIPVGYQTYHWTGLKDTQTVYYWKVTAKFHGSYPSYMEGYGVQNFSDTSSTQIHSFTTNCEKSLRIEPIEAAIMVDETQQFKSFYDPDGQGPQPEQEVTNQSVWSTQEPLIATITNKGLATGRAEGSVKIQATYAGLTADATLNVTSPSTLSADLIASPAQGTAPLNDVALTAAVYGTAEGTINYTFWCNCSDSGTNIDAVKSVCGNFNHKIDGTNDNPYTALDICDYPTEGTYTPKVIVERGLAASAEARTNITVNEPLGPNNPPQASNLRMAPASCGPSCHDCSDPLHPILYWTFSDPDEGDTQSKYRIEFDTNKNFSSPEATIERESSSQTVTLMDGSLEFNKTYYWRMKVWDNNGLESPWACYSNSGISCVSANLKSYITPIHQYPTPDFTWSPTKPKKGEEVQFEDKSQAFGSSTINQWKWEFGGGAIPPDSDVQNPITTYQGETGSKTAKLTVWDSSEDGLWCDISKTMTVKTVLPKWREIIPW